MSELPKGRLDVGPNDKALSPDEVLSLSIFQGLAPKQFGLQPGAVVLRRFERDQIICHQGGEGYSAFYILTDEDLASLENVGRDTSDDVASDSVASATNVPMDLPVKAAVYVNEHTAAEASRGRNGLLGLLARKMGVSEKASIATKDKAAGGKAKHVADMYAGELFGEMACLTGRPRSATVKATDQVVVVEMLLNILRMVQENKKNALFHQKRVESIYNQRALRSHLAQFPILQGIDSQTLETLIAKADLVQLAPGEVLFQEGDDADGMYFISLGQIKVVKKSPGGERIEAYLSRGDVLGEIALVESGPRNATCIAGEHVLRGSDRKPKQPVRIELIKLDDATFQWLLEAEPVVRERIHALIESRTKGQQISRTTTLPMSGAYDEQGIAHGQKLMLIDLDRCTRCDECVRACVSTHDDGQSRLFREGLRFGNYLVPASCRLCRDPVCLIGCPVGSIHKGATGEITIEDWCIGCTACADQCPYDAITMSVREGEQPDAPIKITNNPIAVTCDQCNSISDGMPSCVYACPHDAAMRVDGATFFGS